MVTPIQIDQNLLQEALAFTTFEGSHSSESYLRNLGYNILKVDRKFLN